MNKIYHIKAIYKDTRNMIEYYDSCIIIANSIKEVNAMIDGKHEIKTKYQDKGYRSIDKIGTSNLPTQEVMASYNIE